MIIKSAQKESIHISNPIHIHVNIFIQFYYQWKEMYNSDHMFNNDQREATLTIPTLSM